MDVSTLESKVKNVEDDLDDIRAKLKEKEVSEAERIALRNAQVALLKEKQQLKDEIKSLTAPTPAGSFYLRS